MNERDSEALACLLEEQGFLPAASEEDADVLLFNTCSVRAQAENKVLGKVGALRRRKERNPHLVIGIIGCMAENYGPELMDRLPHVDLVVGTRRIHRVPELVQQVLAGRRGMVEVGGEEVDFERLSRHRPGSPTAYVAVMRGCNQFCSYCVVPHVRGREQSRPIRDVVAEVRQLAAAGVREVCLLGQNITAYGLAEARRQGRYSPEISPLADLLRAVSEVDGILRIRFTSPHPRFMNEAFIEAVASLPKVCEALHVPLQSGSDRILKLMRRGYTAEEYRRTIEALRAVRPGMVFSTDVIVGFPTETEEDFEATRRLMNEVDFDMAYVFRYSPRPGTRAAEIEDDVPPDVKLERNKILLADLEERSSRHNRMFIGKTVEVLVEGPSPRNPDRWTGRTRRNKVCLFEPAPGLQRGDLVDVRIERATSHALYGSVEAIRIPAGPVPAAR